LEEAAGVAELEPVAEVFAVLEAEELLDPLAPVTPAEAFLEPQVMLRQKF